MSDETEIKAPPQDEETEQEEAERMVSAPRRVPQHVSPEMIYAAVLNLANATVSNSRQWKESEKNILDRLDLHALRFGDGEQRFTEIEKDVDAHDDWIDDLGQHRHNALDAFLLVETALNELIQRVGQLDNKPSKLVSLAPTLRKRRRRKRRSDTQPAPPPDEAE